MLIKSSLIYYDFIRSAIQLPMQGMPSWMSRGREGGEVGIGVYCYIIMSVEQREVDLERRLTRFSEALRGRKPDTIRASIAQLQQLSPESHPNEGQSHALHERVQQTLSPGKIARYRMLKEKMAANQQTIRVVQRGQAVTAAMESFAGEEVEGEGAREVEQSHRLFLLALQSVKEFQQLGVHSQSGVNLSALRQQLYLQMLGKITPATHGTDHTLDRLRKVIAGNKLPLKKDEVRKVGLGEQDRRFFLSCLYREYSLSTVRLYLQGLLEQQPRLGENCVLQEYWQQGRRAAAYFFISNSQLRNLEEPGWMFEYLQHVLNANYKFFLEFVTGRGGVRPEIASNLTRHFLGESYRCFFQPMVERRLGEDLMELNEFLLFNFLDELGKLQDKLAASFGVRPNLIEKVLLHFDGSHQILQRCLQYEQKWFQTKIFEDFVNIDYSRVNLKNLDAYNIVSNFLSLIERLQHKFANVSHPDLRGRVVEFYSGQVLQVVAQVKTSFDRIYNHSRLPKIDVLLSFKRIEGDLRSALAGLLSDQPKLEDALEHDYHAFLEQYFQVCALEAVTPTHKKLHISLGEVMGYLCREEEHEHEKYINAFGRIFEEWAGRLEQVGKFAPYTDLKVRAIFFKYLQATNFTPVGLNLYLKIFEPYLRLIFTEDRHRALLAMITMRREAFLEYTESHADSLTFLNAEERKQLQSFKRTVNIE